MITVIGPRESGTRTGGDIINTTSRASSGLWRQLSPFYLGPVELWDGHVARRMENAWQYSKVYPGQVDEDNEPTKAWLRWAIHGWSQDRAVRYPMGKGAVPAYSYWDGFHMDYIEARNNIYCPLYAKLVTKTVAYRTLKERYEKGEDITLWDFDGYDHRKLGMTYRDVLNCTTRKMGHAFVLAMCLSNKRRWE